MAILTWNALVCFPKKEKPILLASRSPSCPDLVHWEFPLSLVFRWHSVVEHWKASMVYSGLSAYSWRSKDLERIKGQTIIFLLFLSFSSNITIKNSIMWIYVLPNNFMGWLPKLKPLYIYVWTHEGVLKSNLSP